jgi:1-deoxy-D-xylulose-5-phosphate synthase
MRHMIYTAVSHDGPAAVRFPRGSGVGVPLDSDFRYLPLGKGRLIFGEQSRSADVLILGLGSMAHPAMQAAEQLAEQGLRAWVVDPRFVKPLDEELITGLATTAGRVVVAEEAMLAGGFGSAVLELFDRIGLTRVKVKRLGMADVHLEHGDPAKQRGRFGLDSAGIAKAAIDLCEGGRLLQTAG